jgi:hypothetical protein
MEINASGWLGAPSVPGTSFIRTAWGQISVRDLRSGAWFHRTLTAVLALHEQRRPEAPPDGKRTAAVEAALRRGAAEAALVGAGTASLATAAVSVTAETALAGVVALPAAYAALTGDAVYRAFVQLRMACDVADLHGVKLDQETLLALCAVECGVEPRGDDDEPGRALIERLLALDVDSVAKRVGKRLRRESLWRNGVPWLDLATSPFASWRRTKRLGLAVRRHAALRRAIEAQLAALPEHQELLVEAAWHVFVADEPLDSAEATVLTRLLSDRPALRATMLDRFAPGYPTAWLQRLALLPPETAAPVFHALEVIAAADGVAPPPERELLARAAAVMHTAFDDEPFTRLVHSFASDAA